MDAAEPHEPETRAVALLGVRPPREDAGDDRPVAGPVCSAQAISRDGVHSACARCARGMCAICVESRPRPVRRTWEATRRALTKTSTVAAREARLDVLRAPS